MASEDNTNGSSANWRADIDEFESDLKQKCPKDDEKEKCQEDDPVIRSKKVLDNVAFHDFAFYEFLLPTEEGYRKTYGSLSENGLAYLNQLQAEGVQLDQIELLANFLVEFETIIKNAVYVSLGPHYSDSWSLPLIEELYDNYSDTLAKLFGIYCTTGTYRKDFLGEISQHLTSYIHIIIYLGNSFRWSYWFSDAFGPWDISSGYSLPESQFPLRKWMYEKILIPTTIRNIEGFQSYPFEIFPYYSVNIGMRLVYRQEWKPLSTQPGEIVRTIPLGPGQKERVTTKITRRKKRTSTMETVTETETTTESTDTTKDSNEIVSEAASSFNWKVDAEVHGGISVIGGSASTSFGGSSEDKSKKTSSDLSETMQKSASKIRRETKVTVSTESEETFEREQFSEISNPNNEMAITYEYLKLQQQYEVFTYLAEVQSVIFVAEYLPPPGEIGKDWVRKHDWIIAKVLKDESHRQTLNDLIQDVDEKDLLEDVSGDPFEDMIGVASEKFASFEPNTGAQGGGLTVPDIYAEPQRIYREHLKEEAARKRANNIRDIKRNRLYDHIRGNILHYCQAIWSHEDPEQRILRYKKENRRVPIEWRAPLAIQQIGQQIQYTPTGKDAPLWELVDPTGPLGYMGNYAVFGLRPLPEQELPDELNRGGIIIDIDRYFKNISLDTLMSRLREDYVDDDGTLLDPALTSFIRQTEKEVYINPEAEEKVYKDRNMLKTLSDSKVIDFLSYLPRLWDELVDGNGDVMRDETQNSYLTK